METKIIIKQPVKFTTGKVSLMIKRHRVTLLDWEKQGKIPPAHREPSSRHRYWTPEEVQRIIDYAAA